MAWITPKTNWTTSDYYNFGDLNRVENNSDYLATLIGTYAATPILTGITTTRDNTRIEYYDNLNRVEGNIEILETAAGTPLIWDNPKTTWVSLEAFDNLDAIRLEDNLLQLKNMIDNIISELRFCGAFICGTDFDLSGGSG